MAKQIIKGKRLRLLEDIVQIHNSLVVAEAQITSSQEDVEALRFQQKELRTMRNDKILEALRADIPGKQIGERIGITRASISQIKQKQEL